MNGVVLASQLLSVALALGGSAYTLGQSIVGAWHAHERARIAAEIRPQAGWIDEVIWDVAPRHWIPAPWAPPSSPIETLATLGQAQARALIDRPLPHDGDPDLWRKVRAYHRDWATRWRFCANVELQYPGLGAGICDDYRRFPAAWRTGLLFKRLNRRSQRRSLTWKRFTAYIRPLFPKARILHDLYPIPWWKTQTGSRMV